MNDKDFVSIWRSSTGSDLVKVEQRSLLHDLSSKMNKLDEKIRKRNIREYVIASLVIIAFCVIAYLVPYTLTKIASLLMIPYYLFYMYKIVNVRGQKSSNFSQPLKQFLISQKRYFRKEKELLDSILYWAIIPLAFILILFYAGFPMDLPSHIWTGGFSFIILFGVYWANKYVARKTFKPLLHSLEKLIREFDEKD